MSNRDQNRETTIRQVASTALLMKVGPTSREDRDVVFVEAANALFSYDAQSAAAANGTTIIAPESGTGRWNKLTAVGDGPTLSDANPAALGAAAPGVSADASRADHVHATPPGGPTLSDANPAALGAAAPGVSANASRADHVHAHGNQGGGTEHADAIAYGASGFLTGTEKAQLSGAIDTPGAAQWRMHTFTFANLTDTAGLTKDLNLRQYQAEAKIIDAMVRLVTPFTGGAIASVAVKVGAAAVNPGALVNGVGGLGIAVGAGAPPGLKGTVGAEKGTWIRPDENDGGGDSSIASVWTLDAAETLTVSFAAVGANLDQLVAGELQVHWCAATPVVS